MLTALIRAALTQRLVVAALALMLCAFGLREATRLSVDAFPDVTNVQVQIATEATGRSPEEIERFVTVPLEIALTGLPGLVEMRSLNKSGLSIITLVFTDKTDVFFARQLVTERLIEVTPRMPQGITRCWARCPLAWARFTNTRSTIPRTASASCRPQSWPSGASFKTGWFGPCCAPFLAWRKSIRKAAMSGNTRPWSSPTA